jgi:lipoate-protein ligase A
MRLFEFTYPGIAENLALDEALLEEAEEGLGGPVVRVWESPAVAVVLGASGRLREDVRVEACRADGVPIARRSSGGGTVVVGPGALNVTVVLPQDAAPGLAAVDLAHKFVLERMAEALRALGTPVEVQGLGDLTLGDRKFAGSAQRRLRRHFFVHATILDRFPLDRIGRYTALPRRQPSYRRGRSHEEFVTNLGLGRDLVVGAIRSAWLAFDPGEGAGEASIPEERVRRLAATKFAERSWVERL